MLTQVLPGRGVLVEFVDSASIERALCELLDDSPRMERLAQAAFTYARGLSWSAVARRYLSLFNNLTVGARG